MTTSNLTDDQLRTISNAGVHYCSQATFADLILMARECLTLRDMVAILQDGIADQQEAREKLNKDLEDERLCLRLARQDVERLERHISVEQHGHDPDHPAPAFERWRCRAHVAERECAELKEENARMKRALEDEFGPIDWHNWKATT